MKKYKIRSRWSRMLSRCEDDDYVQYKDYGGRGIFVCEAWHDFNKFYEWCLDNNLEPGLQIDRIDNDGPYSPENCSVVTRKENGRNKRNTRLVEIDGTIKSAIEWTEDDRCCVPYTTFLRRLNLGWDALTALTTKSQPKNTTGTLYGKKRVGGAYNANTYKAFGEEKTLFEWARDDRCVVKQTTLSSRVHHGWPIERAITQPLGPQGGSRLAS